MTYALRVWVNDKLEETLETPDVTVALARFRAIVAEWPKDWALVRWYAVVYEAPGPLTGPDSWSVESRWRTVASYQHAPQSSAAA